MSPLFDRLSDLFERGHRSPAGDLLSDDRNIKDSPVADAAVLIAVTDRARPGVLLTQRPNDMRDHPGQVAFPGGKVDDGEDVVSAALREAEEEIALARDHVRVIGTTDRYQTGTGFDITPVLGVVPPDLDLMPNPTEVADWFEAPLDLLLKPGNWTEHEVMWRGHQRKYLEMHYEGFRIWGVTAAIIFNLSQRITYEGLFGED